MKSVREIMMQGDDLEELEEADAEAVADQARVISEEELEWLELRRGKITGSNCHLLIGAKDEDAKIAELTEKVKKAIVIPESVLSDGDRRGTPYTKWMETQKKTVGDQPLSTLKKSEVEAIEEKITKAVQRRDGFSKQGEHYLRRVLAERLGSSYSFTSASVEWGRQYEAEALAEYSRISGHAIDASPFQFNIVDDDSLLSGVVGSTPDARIIGLPGVVEAKVPKDPAFHMATVISGEIPNTSGHRYGPQCDSHMVCAATREQRVEFCDYVSFDPRMDPREPARLIIIRRYYEPEPINYLRRRLELAADWLVKATYAMRSTLARQQIEKSIKQLSAEDMKTVQQRIESNALKDDIPF